MSALRQWFSVTLGSVEPWVGTKGNLGLEQKGLGSWLERGSYFQALHPC